MLITISRFSLSVPILRPVSSLLSIYSRSNLIRMNSNCIESAIDTPKIITIIGTTGSGKTKLSLDLAEALNGEIVNTDLIQMYHGLDIAAAKVQEEEKRGIPHHMFSFLFPRQVFTVRNFSSMAHYVIEDILRRGKVPIIVGGSMYYVQSILLNGGMLDESGLAAHVPDSEKGLHTRIRLAVPEDPVEVLYERLQDVDPIMASRLHHNDHRKILRSLEAYDNTGVPYSKLISIQKEVMNELSNRYNSYIFWLQVGDASVLSKRLDDRVETMMKRGLMKEQLHLKAYLDDDLSKIHAFLPKKDVRSLDPLATQFAEGSDQPSDLTLRALQYHVDTSLCAISSPYFNSSISGSGAGEIGDVGAVDDAAEEEFGSTGAGRSVYAGLLQAIGYKEFEEFFTLRQTLLDRFPDATESIMAVSWEEVLTKVDSHGSALSSRKGPSGGTAGIPEVRKRARNDAVTSKGDHVTANDAPGASTSLVLESDQHIVSQSDDLIPETKSIEVGLDMLRSALAAAVERVQVVTRQYARKQEKWIQQRFYKRGLQMHIIDSSLLPSDKYNNNSSLSTAADGEQSSDSAIVGDAFRTERADSGSGDLWSISVSSPAVIASRAFLAKKFTVEELNARIKHANDPDSLLSTQKFHCDVCGATVIGKHLWDGHRQTKRHKKSLSVSHQKMMEDPIFAERVARSRLEKERKLQLQDTESKD